MSAATKEGTERYRSVSELPATAYRMLGRTGLTTSVLGFGCYRVDVSIVPHRTALSKALLEGCNLIDSSTNYADGGSEECVGEVLTTLSNVDKLQRDGVIVVSKVGYVQGENLKLAQAREAEGRPFPEMVKVSADCWHCMHPDFIADQLPRSLERTKLETIDVYLVHNPEYFFNEPARRGHPLEAQRQEFYRRIEAAFEKLEDEVTAGRLQHYGVSSNTFGGEADDAATTSVGRMWEIAESIAERRHGSKTAHHFSMIQLPMNFYESGPYLEANTGEGGRETALAFAKEHNLAVLINRPLNAFHHNQLVRLADFGAGEAGVTSLDKVRAVVRLEEEFAGEIAPHVKIGERAGNAKELFTWGRELGSLRTENVSFEHWSQIEGQVIRPQVDYLLVQLDANFSRLESKPKWERWRAAYRPALDALLRAIRVECSRRAQEKSNGIHHVIDAFLPEPWKMATLSQKALGTLIHTPGVTCVLSGMRSGAYVNDALGAVKLPALTVTRDLYQAFQTSH